MVNEFLGGLPNKTDFWHGEYCTDDEVCPVRRPLNASHASGELRSINLLTCFRIPRQSGWGTDEGRKLRYRRIDRYLTPLPIPMKPYTGQRSGVTTSFHRPLGDYVNGLATEGFLVDAMKEITTHRKSKTRAERLSDEEIPVFLGLRARKLSL